MSNSYTIKSGDTLLGIAVEHNVLFDDILALNPEYQANPDKIFPGKTIRLPKEETLKPTVETKQVPPPSALRDTCKKGAISSEPTCTQKELVDLVFVLDDKHKPADFYCITQEDKDLLLEEEKINQGFIKQLKELNSKAPNPETATEEDVKQHVLDRQAWLESVINAGVVGYGEDKSSNQSQVASTDGSDNSSNESDLDKDENQKKIESRIDEISKKIAFVDTYTNEFLQDKSSKIIGKKMLAELKEDKKYWQALSDKTKEKASKPNKSKVALNDFAHSRKKTLKPASAEHIKEIVVAGENRTIYVRPQFLSREKDKHWVLNKSDVGFKEALDALDPQKFKKKLQESLRQDLFKNKDIPKTLKANIAQWNVEGWNWKEWEAHGYINNSDGQTVFAVSSSAKLFRWAAQASADSKLELQEGVSADIGVGANASFSLAEAAVKTEAYVPYKQGWELSLTYQNESKEDCRYSFGRFRFSAAIELSAFLGVTASGNMGATATTDKKVENPNPGTDIIIAPNVSVGSQDRTENTPGGNIGVKAEGFAGAQLGGQVTGAVEWLDPDDAPKLDFAALAQVTAEGNVAFGAGAGVDFQLALLNEKFYLHCSAQVVWGPGAKGGFATEIDGGKLFDLFIVIAKGLQYVDYRQLKNIESPVYEYFKNSTYVAFASEFFESPDEALSSYFNKGVRFVNNFFIESRKLREDALRIADNVLNDNSQVWEKYDQSLLFPETIGMMLNTLVTDFFWRSTEKQEKAICYLLSKTVTSWRKLSEILCRMNKDGHKDGNVNAMITNLTRINAILDGDQQDEFDDWILELSVIDKRNLLNRDGRLAYTPLTGDQFRNKEAEVRGKIARLTTPDSNEYIV